MFTVFRRTAPWDIFWRLNLHFSVVLSHACHLAQGIIVAMSRVSRQQEALIEQHMLLKAEARKAAEVGHLNAELKAKAGAPFVPVLRFLCILATRRTASYPHSPSF